MNPDADASTRMRRHWAAAGAFACALAVASGAYAAHGLDGLAQSRLQSAAQYLFLDGIGLIAASAHAATRFRTLALAGVLLGTLVFAGSLAGAALFGWPPRFAPAGGSLLILSWITLAVSFLRRG